MQTVNSAKRSDSMKRSLCAPCLYRDVDNNGHIVLRAPAVDCEWNCDQCGFNPRVKERRLAKLGNR